MKNTRWLTKSSPVLNPNISRPAQPSKTRYQVSQKKFTLLAGSGIKSMWPIFKAKMLIFPSKANLDEKILFGKITHL